MKEGLIDDLLLKCMLDMADEQECETAYRWIHSNKDNLACYQAMRDSWIASGIIMRNNEYDNNKAWEKVARKTGIRRNEWRQVNLAGWRQIAAIFIIAFISGITTYHFAGQGWESGVESNNIIQAPLGSKTNLILPDGTEIWLNAGSTLKYSSHYNVHNRSVHLTGEAFFDVAKGNDLSFEVFASDLVIKALGTSFNVKAYPEDNKVETTLVTGKVYIENKSGDAGKIVMSPNQKASFIPGGSQSGCNEEAEHRSSGDSSRNRGNELQKVGKIEIEKVPNTEVYTSWKDKRLVFERERFSDLTKKLERIYDVQITMDDEELKNYHLTGSLDQETLEQLLYAVRLTVPLDFEIKNKHVIFSLNQELKEKYSKSQIITTE